MGTNASSAQALNTTAESDLEADADLEADTAVEAGEFDDDDDDEWVKVELEEGLSAAPSNFNSLVIAVDDDDDFEAIEGRALDEESFPCFAPLLSASQAYASHSGCRFRSSDFCDLPVEDSTDVIEVRRTSKATDEDAEASACRRLVAKLQAAPAVASFAKRLRAGERELVEEMTRAYDVVMNESVRNAMVAGFRELGLWPPSPAPTGIEDSDCDFEDLSAPIPVIAQRIYNDETHRRRDSDLFGSTVSSRHCQRATTASYLVDFVYETGVQLPMDAGDRHVSLLQRFGERVSEYEREAASLLFVAANCDDGAPECPTFDERAIARVTVDHCELEAAKWWSDCWQEALWAFTSTVFLSATASAGISLLRRSLRGEMKMQKMHSAVEGALTDEASDEETWLEREPMQQMGPSGV